jgi:DNA end-binding protein Ku
MAHKLESAHISFGLVTIPVGIYSAIEEQDLHFNQLHGACGSRIKQRRFCPVCNRDVEYDELVKGYEIAKDQYVHLTPTDFDQLQAAESDAMQIVEFVPLTAIDPIYFENTFHLGAEKQGDKAYQLLVQAMEHMERVALAKFVWRGKDGLYVIRAVEARLLLHKMHYQDEIREFEAKPRTDQKPGATELKLAAQLIESISSPAFDAKAYRDDYRERVMELIKEKSKGKTLKLQPKAARNVTNVVDLMQRLKESVAQTTQKRGARSRALPAQTPREPAKKAVAGRR